MKTIIGLLIITMLIISNKNFGQASCEDIQQQIHSYNKKIEQFNIYISNNKNEVRRYTSKISYIPESLKSEKEWLQKTKENYEKVKNNQRLVRWPGWPDEITKTFTTEAGDISITVNGSDTVSITAPETIKEINIYFKKWESDSPVELISHIEEGTLMQNISNINTKSCKFVLSKDIPKNWYDAQGKFDTFAYNTMDIVLNNNKIIETTFNIQVDKETSWGQGN